MSGRPASARWVRRGFLGILFGGLVLGSLFDRGADGAARLTLFPAGLTLSDPYVWDALWNSVCVAVLTALFALGVGTPIGWIFWRWRPLGSRVLPAAFSLTGVVPPLCLAIGLKMATPAISEALERSAVFSSWASRPQWFQFFWAEASWATAWVVGVAAASLRRLDPSWEDAARIAGASPRQIAASLIWPRIRPELMRAAGLIASAVVFEPGAPLVLELRRTLAVSLLESAATAHGAASCSVLTGLGVAAALLIQAIFRLAGGPVIVTEAGRVPARHPLPPLGRRLLAALPVLLVLLAGWAPILVLVHRLFRSGGDRLSDLPAALRNGPVAEAILWTLGLAAVTGVLIGLTRRAVDGVAGRRDPRASGPSPPGDGIPPSFLCGLLILSLIQGWGFVASPGSSGRIFAGWETLQVWRGSGFAPLAWCASLWLTAVLSRIASPLAWPRTGRPAHDGYASPPPEPARRLAGRLWRHDLGLAATLVGPALLFGTPGRSVAVLLAGSGYGSPAPGAIALLALALVGFSMTFRGADAGR